MVFFRFFSFPPSSASRPQQARRGPVPRIESYQRPLGAHPRCRSRPQRYQRPKWTAQSPASAIGPRDVRQRPPASGGASRCRAARRRRRRGTLIGQEASPTMGPSRRMRERPVRLHARLRDRASRSAVAADAHGGHEMPAPRPRAGCDPPRGHGNAGGVGRAGCGQNLVRFARIFAALEPKWHPPKRGPKTSSTIAIPAAARAPHVTRLRLSGAHTAVRANECGISPVAAGPRAAAREEEEAGRGLMSL